MTTDRLAQIEARISAATEGPWRDGMGTHGNPADGPEFCDVRTAVGAPVVAEIALDMQGGADAAFIAHARTDIPDLVAALREIEARHRPDRVPQETYGDPTVPDIRAVCSTCRDGDEDSAPWPCPDARVLARFNGGAS